MGGLQPPAGELLLTYEDYLRLPADGKKYEILEGVLHVTPSPTTRHQRVCRNLHHLLHVYVTANDLGEVFFAPLDVVFSHTTVLQPDIFFVSREKQGIVTEKHVAGAPDLVVEVISSATSGVDRVTKAQVYARYGVPYYWVVDPEARVLEEFRLERGIYMLVNRWEGETAFAPALFPGLVMDLKKVWA